MATVYVKRKVKVNKIDPVMNYYLVVCKIANKYAAKCNVDANDLVQDAYIDILKSVDRINVAKNRVSYAGKIASRSMWRSVSGKNVEMPMSDSMKFEEYEEMTCGSTVSEPITVLCSSLRDLPSYNRFMLAFGGMSQRELAETEGRSVQAINTGIALFRKRAAQKIIDSYEDAGISVPNNFRNSRVLKRKVTYDDLYAKNAITSRPRRKEYDDRNRK